MWFDSDCFFQIEEWQGCEDICLKECYEELEEPKWYNYDASESDTSCWDKCTNIGHNSDKDNSCKYISEKSDRKGECSREFSDEVEPSNRNIDDFLHGRMSSKIEEIVSKVCEETFVSDCCHLRNEDNRYCHYNGCIKVRIDRTEVCVPTFEDEVDPIESETEYIGEEDIYEESTDQRKERACVLLALHRIEEEIIDSFDEVYSDVSEPWKRPSFDRSEEESNNNKENRHENPHGEYGIGDRYPCDRKTRNRLSLNSRDMDSHLVRFLSICLYFTAHRNFHGKPVKNAAIIEKSL